MNFNNRMFKYAKEQKIENNLKVYFMTIENFFLICDAVSYTKSVAIKKKIIFMQIGDF